ncbi:MAG: hypothetical protein SFW65_05815 [Alphaproteobacteria bacterium]|nr:hypothetical protein [Alphaproteobacteria bacterium]
MINYAAGASFCAYPRAEDIEVRMIPPALFSFRGAKQALRRSINIAARATSIAGFVLFAGLIAYNYASSHLSTRTAQKFAADIDMSIEVEKAGIEQAHALRSARYESYVRQHIDPAFDLAKWQATLKQPKPDHIAVTFEPFEATAAVSAAAFDGSVMSVHYAVPSRMLVQAPLINASYVAHTLGAKHPLVARFKDAERICPPVPSTVQLDERCGKRMAPLYQQFGDAVVAQTRVEALQLASVAARKHVSAPATKLLKIQQPRQDAKVNRPVKVADAKPHKKKAVRPVVERFDAATFFSQMNHS